jgi:haloalkane dehalogenase
MASLRTVNQIVADSAKWLESSDVPKLLLTFEPGAILGPKLAEWCQRHIRNLEMRRLGPGIHFVQEDQPEGIGRAVREWIRSRIRIVQ